MRADGVEVAAVCDADPAKARAAAAEFSVTKSYASAAELFATEKLDFVDIATQMHAHEVLVTWRLNTAS